MDKNWNLKIADFGLARLNTETHKRGTLGRLRGTYTYCAPEIYFNQPFTTKSDIFSIGVILWEIVVRVVRGKYERPYSEFPELMYDYHIILQTSKGKRCTIPPACPASLSKLVSSCWDPVPANRPSSAELISEFQKIQREYRMHQEEWDSVASATGSVLAAAASAPQFVAMKRQSSTSEDDGGNAESS